MLLTTAVFVEDHGGLFSVSQMGMFCTGHEQHAKSVRIKQVLSSTIRMV